MREAILANNKSSAKLSWKRKEAIQISSSIYDYLADKGFQLPPGYVNIFGRGFKLTDIAKRSLAQYENPEQEAKALRKEYVDACEARATRFFTDRETGECFYDDYVELAKAYYTLRNSSPAVYALFKHPNNNHFTRQLVAATCSRHRLDPVWNYKKSKLLRGIWHRFLQETRIHEKYQPMHLMLTVPHKGGEWMGKKFYAREFIERFNRMRKLKGWKRCIHGGEYGIEITRSGNDGLHIHMHCLVFMNKIEGKFNRDLVNRYIRRAWHQLTSAKVTWFETLFIHQKDANGRFIMETTEGGIPVLDKDGQYESEDPHTGQNYSIHTEGIVGKRKKFYLDRKEPWYQMLTPAEKLNAFCQGVMECIKYHFKTDCFKGKNNEWDVELMGEVLKHSRNLRMYSRFGAFYREPKLNYTRLEKKVEEVAELVVDTELDEAPLIAEGLDADSDGVAGRLINPYTNEVAERGLGYVNVIALPDRLIHAKDKKGRLQAPTDNQVHDMYFKVHPFVSLRQMMRAIMTNRYEEILIENDVDRLRRCGWLAKRKEAVYV